MSALKTNVIASTIAMMLIGGMRFAFNATITRAFGAEVNGHANLLIAMMFLVSLPATTSLPPVMVRQVARSLAAGNKDEAAAHARLTVNAAAVLSLLAIAGVALFYRLPPLELAAVAVGILGYAYWRIIRSLFLAIGRAIYSVKADFAAALAMPAILVPAILFDRPELAVVSYVAVYAAFALITLPAAIGPLRGAPVRDPRLLREFLRYNVISSIGNAASLATRELAILVLEPRADRATVGELSYALSALTLLAFAPRVLELPMLSELGQSAPEKKRLLTERALHFMWIAVFALGCGAAILAPQILAFGGISSSTIAICFAIIAFVFASEMIQGPATNLIFSEAHPGVLTTIGVISFAGALAWWYVPFTAELVPGVLGVVTGLAISYAIKAIGIGAWARIHYGVRGFRRPFAKLAAIAAGGAMVYGSLAGELDGFLAFAIFEAAMLAAFHRELLELLRILLPRKT
jgi:O-antigen/teichoic acid export membrane protein